MKTLIYLVRHGESLGNKNSQFLGHTDLDLSELGYTQADMTADALRDVHFDAIYSSDLIRAYNTALPHARLRSMDIVPSKNLREIYVGEWEGMLVEDIKAKYHDEFWYGWRAGYGTFTTPGGESVLGAGRRFYNEMERISKENSGNTILVTAHASVIRTFYALTLSTPPERIADDVPFPSNASYSIFEYEDGKFTPISYSNDKHMGDLVTFISDKRIEK